MTRDQSEAALNLGITTLTTTEKVNVQPLFIYEICVDPKETVINQKEVDERNAEIASWKPPEDDKEAVCELEDIEPVVGQVFRYSYSLKEATSAVHLAFDDCLSSKYIIKRRSGTRMEHCSYRYSVLFDLIPLLMLCIESYL